MSDFIKNTWNDQPQQSTTAVMTDDGLRPLGHNLAENIWNEAPATPQMDRLPRYVIKVNGAVVSMPYPTSQQALQHLQSLPPSTQMVAEIVQVDASGNQLLLG